MNGRFISATSEAVFLPDPTADDDPLSNSVKKNYSTRVMEEVFQEC